VNAAKGWLTGFARSKRGLQFALVQDGTGKTAKEIAEMGPWDRALTAMIRGRFYREKKRQAEKAQNQRR